MAGVLYYMFSKHNIRPSEFRRLPTGERLFLMACAELEIEQNPKGGCPLWQSMNFTVRK